MRAVITAQVYYLDEKDLTQRLNEVGNVMWVSDVNVTLRIREGATR